ncbi:hypothetical protein FDH29_gp08 [Aquamicrobium phage P14]|uniref:Uncharacterized protein n=1 Tax=Aquamicrobium phage P14 TaxID=1927013 RepID=A0A1L5C032_9CAUD|nr:hypothetical protein FDH29_gp08 [Aquamicrobium phage P14]APL99466.1 hypothetical protein BB738_0080 [Aquamicrobium phage P14]
MSPTKFKPGDKVRCVGSRGYLFTTGKVYVVEKYIPETHHEHFTWPDYVSVVDDAGRRVECHASRFVRA